MSKKSLHKEIKKLLPGPKRALQRIVVHALIDLGKVKILECSYESCLYRSRKFSIGVGNANNPRGLTIDHTRGHKLGDRYQNLNVMHHGCNSAKGSIDYWKDPEAKKKLSSDLSNRWLSPEYRRQQIERMSGENHWSKKPGALKSYPKGDDHWTRKEGASEKMSRIQNKESTRKKRSRSIKKAWRNGLLHRRKS